jgi:hypothetical protein
MNGNVANCVRVYMSSEKCNGHTGLIQATVIAFLHFNMQS